MKTLKNIVALAISLVAAAAFIALTAEAETFWLQILTTAGSAAVLWGCWKMITKFYPELKEEEEV
ncbi:MAG: hypothetical protein HUJ76_08420 [Parasporobacterium sp.]|nr:hypothetical protein [Parasporobacterium sp.]